MAPKGDAVGGEAWVIVRIFDHRNLLQLGDQWLDFASFADQALLEAFVTREKRRAHATVLLNTINQLQQDVAGLECCLCILALISLEVAIPPDPPDEDTQHADRHNKNNQIKQAHHDYSNRYP